MLAQLIFLVGFSVLSTQAECIEQVEEAQVFQGTAGHHPEGNNFANTFGKLGVEKTDTMKHY